MAISAALALATGIGIYTVQSSSDRVEVRQTAAIGSASTSTTRAATSYNPIPSPSIPSSGNNSLLTDQTSELARLLAPKEPPSLTVSCPDIITSGAASVPASFGHQIKAGSAPIAHWEVDYGDGKHYQTDEKPGAAKAVFNHTYTSSGSYIFAVTVSDENGLQDYDNCVFSWFKPYSSTIPGDAVTPPSYSIPDYSIPDYDLPDYSDPSYPPGGYNDAGCPRDQWVNGYYRKDGTYVNGYYRNSPTDGCGGG